MNIKYYNFITPIGEMNLFFSSNGIISLSLPNSKEDEVFKHIKNKYGHIDRVDSSQYEFHNQIIEYLKGELREFTLKVDLRGTEFQKKVWSELLNIPYGETRTYKDIANVIGVPNGYRAVGGALNQNPIPIIVPCHRVIGSNGQLVGFGGGIDLKRRLLELERGNGASLLQRDFTFYC